jgi:phosphatidylglycerol:prolipoprotein diacylglycerol transferase
MRPILFVIPGWDFQVHSYGVMIFIACMSSLAIGVWRARREKIHTDVVYELATWLFLGGVIGARGLYVLTHPEGIHHFSDVMRSWQGGNVFYGCILGGLTGSLIYWFRRPFPFWPMTDVAAPAVAIGAALGRIGCFLNGCCHGAVCDLPWAVTFPAGSHAWVRQANAGLITPDAARSLPVHPTQLYASLAAFVVLAMILAYFPRRKRPGEAMALLMILYSVTRWPIEALRGDESALFAGMTLSQNISIGLFLCGLALWVGLRRRDPGTVRSEAVPAGTRFDPAHNLLGGISLSARPEAPNLERSAQD